MENLVGVHKTFYWLKTFLNRLFKQNNGKEQVVFSNIKSDSAKQAA